MREKPGVILVQNPPVFSVLTVWIYSVFAKSRFIVDSHNGAFNRTRWKLFLWLYKYLSKKAELNILHAKKWADKLSEWGSDSMTMGYIPYLLEANGSYPFSKGFNMVVVNTFSDDEPLEEVYEDMKKAENVNFYITGDLSHAPRHLIKDKAKNIFFTGFLSFNEYAALLNGCDGVICLTKHDNTVQNGAMEAMSLEKPIITSDWPVLRDMFYKGAVHIDHSSSSLFNAVKTLQKNYSLYKKEIKLLKDEKIKQCENNMETISGLISERPSSN
jgi:glycosyltransferase involved in cell wall biosynthesis